MGEYGTGKTHHLIKLRDDITSGKHGSDVTAIYLGSLGVSFRKFYENIIEALKQNTPAIRDTLERLPDVEQVRAWNPPMHQRNSARISSPTSIESWQMPRSTMFVEYFYSLTKLRTLFNGRITIRFNTLSRA
jgi:hypothetical protein